MKIKQGVLYLTVMGLGFVIACIFHYIYELALHAKETGWVIDLAFSMALASPLVAFFMKKRIAVVRHERDMGKLRVAGHVFDVSKTVIALPLCIIAFLVVSIIASLGKAMKLEVIDAERLWYHVIIGIAEEFYYRAMVINAANMAFQAKNKAAGFGAFVAIAILTLASAFNTVTIYRALFFVIATVVFTVLAVIPRRDRRTVAGDIAGIAASALLFSLAHWQVYATTAPEMMIATFVIGAICGLFYVWTRNIAVTAAAHAINNFANGLHLVLATLAKAIGR